MGSHGHGDYARGYGMRSLPPLTPEQRAANCERVRLADEAHARSKAAWALLCGMADPIGRAVDL